MDLIKIGKYISEKRKALGLTQKQLAEKIGMSDKSVSQTYRFTWNCVRSWAFISMNFWPEKILRKNI